MRDFEKVANLEDMTEQELYRYRDQAEQERVDFQKSCAELTREYDEMEREFLQRQAQAEGERALCHPDMKGLSRALDRYRELMSDLQIRNAKNRNALDDAIYDTDQKYRRLEDEINDQIRQVSVEAER